MAIASKSIPFIASILATSKPTTGKFATNIFTCTVPIL